MVIVVLTAASPIAREHRRGTLGKTETMRTAHEPWGGVVRRSEIWYEFRVKRIEGRFTGVGCWSELSE